MALLHAIQMFVGSITTVNPTLTTVYTVPAGFRVILREVTVRNKATVAANALLSVNTTIVRTFVMGAGSSATDSAEARFWIVLAPGDTVKLTGTQAAGFGTCVSGSIYSI